MCDSYTSIGITNIDSSNSITSVIQSDVRQRPIRCIHGDLSKLVFAEGKQFCSFVVHHEAIHGHSIAIRIRKLHAGLFLKITGACVTRIHSDSGVSISQVHEFLIERQFRAILCFSGPCDGSTIRDHSGRGIPIHDIHTGLVNSIEVVICGNHLIG